MITALDIKGFKSIREIHLDCRRINLFIGEPNTGKSNILEALGFLSWLARGGALSEYVRFAHVRDLFFDGITVRGNLAVTLNAEQIKLPILGLYEDGTFWFGTADQQPSVRLNWQGAQVSNFSQLPQLGFIRFYRFQTLAKYPSDETSFLLPPKGENLVALLYASKELRELAGEYFAPSGWLFVVKPQEQEIAIQRLREGVAVSFPYANSSDTLQRMIFYMAAIESSKNATLVFEEPETHAFPYYVKHLAERIALDENANQYFIATHNPYLLTAIWEKSSADDIAVFATYYRDYETKVKPLSQDDMTWLFDADPFAGVSHLVEDAQ